MVIIWRICAVVISWPAIVWAAVIRLVAIEKALTVILEAPLVRDAGTDRAPNHPGHVAGVKKLELFCFGALDIAAWLRRGIKRPGSRNIRDKMGLRQICGP